MPANYVPVGEPAHDAERQAIKFIVDGLTADFTVYGNPWIVTRNGVVFELDAVVVAPHAIYVVEIKSYRGAIEGTDHDWYIPGRIPSPLKLNRKTAQELNSQLRREDYRAGQAWTQGLVFLSATTNVGVQGYASRDRLHTRGSILAALQDDTLVKRISSRQALVPVNDTVRRTVHRALTGQKHTTRPTRHVREYEIVEVLDHGDAFSELLGRNRLDPSTERVLRIYKVPPLATDEQRTRIEERARWEAQVLGRIGRSPGILQADPPFSDEAGIVLPFEHFPGITLTSWVERYGPRAHKEKADLQARTDLWIRIAETLHDAHQQGVVHRILRPEVVLVEDAPAPKQIRVTGFDLAKQLSADTTVSLTTLADERLALAAPEVITAFSSAAPASDQFSLGAILALLLCGQPLFESTRALLDARRLVTRVRDTAKGVPLTLDEAVTRMLSIRPTDRYPSIEEAIRAVRFGRAPDRHGSQHLFPSTPPPLDPDNLSSGTRIEPDYEIVSRLGQGGMAVVYAARHLVSGRTRALKVARDNDPAEEALRGEFKVLSELDHGNVVKVVDLSKMVQGRLTLVMERVGGQNLRHWLLHNADPDLNTLRRYAEDLLAGLDYLEHQGITHKDLKPDNLLVGDGGLTIIDFSLANERADALYGGTALYRDPSSARWSHGTDRYAAALCLFELYTARHAFDGRVPQPEERPAVNEEDVDPPGLAAFFHKALDPNPERRFPSAKAMREALLQALGADVRVPDDADRHLPDGRVAPDQLDATTALRHTNLPQRAINALTRSQITTVGQLLTLGAAEIRAIHAIGSKTAGAVIAFVDAARARGVALQDFTAVVEPPLVAELVHSLEPIERLPLSDALCSALADANLPTVGAVARLTRAMLLDIPGIGRARLAEVVEALHRFRDHTPEGAGGAHTLDRLWALASLPLKDGERNALEQVVGLDGGPRTQTEVAKALGVSQPNVSVQCNRALERLEVDALCEAQSAVDSLLDHMGGVLRVDELAARLEEVWAPCVVTGAGLVRLLVRLAGGQLHLVDIDGVDSAIVARPAFDRDTLRAFSAEVFRLAQQWPPVEPESARRTLAALLPHFHNDPLALGVRLCADAQLTDAGHLFVPPLDAALSIGFVLAQVRDPLPLDELRQRVRHVFGPDTPFPEGDHLLTVLRELDCQVQGNALIPGRSHSVMAPKALRPDELPSTLGAEQSHEEGVRKMLVEASRSRGFRMLVTPPELHAQIGPSVARALGGTWVSFEDAFFQAHGGDIERLQRAEQYAAQRDALTEAAEEVLYDLLEEHGRPGHIVVLGDTGLLGICDALDLPRRLYDETMTGSRGFWVVVVPGVIHNRQPRFNETVAMWHLEGATLPLMGVIGE